jgi:hypothetical protein
MADLWARFKNAVGITSAQSSVQDAADKTGLSEIKPPGTLPEPAGTTITGGKKVGGRRHRKTMKGGKKSRKTYRKH